MAANTIGLNQTFPIYNENGTPFHNLVLRKGVVDSVVMSLGDKITGDVYYGDNTLAVTMKEYIEFNGIKYSLVNPPTVVREGVVSDNSELKGMTKYSFEFYHPMYMLANFPFTDVATTVGEEKYLSQNKVFSWIGKPQDFIDKLNKNLQGTVWCVRKSDRFPSDKNNELSDVLTFDNATVAEAIKIGYETWDIPYVVTQIPQTDPLYAQGKRFVVEYGLPSNEIYENDSQRQLDNPFVFRMGKGVGLKNNSRTPRNNKIITRIAGYGSEDNVPYGYPQIVWTGNQDWDYTINNDPNEPLSYPIYKGIVGGQYVKLIKHPFTRTHLMPSIYTDTVNKKVNPYATGYDPTIEIKDYYDAVASQQYPYVNEINLQAPSYDSHEFPDIKPEFDSESSIGIISAIPLNSDLTPADHWDDSIDDDGNYLQSYFQITLPQLDFDLYACAAITQEMQINMRSGACIGCTFTVQVDWDDYKANFYDSDGNFLPDGEQRDLTKYPKSNLGQISVVVQKDNTTFGTLMPNIYQQPVANDLFVFIGISLPLSYITDAEERLDDAMKTYMLENNVFYFDYPLKFDEHFLATHTYILEQIRPNSIIRFEYGGVQQQLFVKQLTVKYGNAALPQYDITLTDNIEVVLNQIGQVADDVEKLSSLLSLLRQSYSRNVWNELAKKLSKTQDDTAQGFIRFIRGLQVGDSFVSGLLGQGGVFRNEQDGTTYIEADKMYIRMKAYFDTIEVKKYMHSSGNRIASKAGFKCVRVEWYDANGDILEQTSPNLASCVKFRCYYRAYDGDDKVTNDFVVGDLAYCRETNKALHQGFSQHGFWRLVIDKDNGNDHSDSDNHSLTEDGEGWIDVSNRTSESVVIDGTTYTHAGYSSSLHDDPMAQDDIIQLGNISDQDRQGAIIEFVGGEDAPSYQIYQGINDYTLVNKNYVRLGYDSQSGGAQAYIGNPNGSSYLWYHLVNGTPKLEIKAKVEITSTESTIDGTPISQYDFYDDTQIWSRIADMQEQIDGAIETYYMVGEPALNLPPVVSTQAHPYDDPWLDGTETPAERTAILNNHVGDLYYDKNTGHGYRFLYDDDSHDFAWVVLTDEDVTEALRIANEAQDTADGKRTIYSVWNAWVKDNVNTLKNGDLFIPTSDTTQGGNTYYARKVYKCTTDGTSAFSEINYTDDSALNSFLVNTYASDKTNLQNQIDGKAETWRQESDPASSWTDADTKAKHVGDLWMDTSANGGKKTYIYTDNGSSANPRYTWEAQDIPDEVFDDIDGKSSIYVNDPTAAQNPTPTDYKKRDLWILGGAATINGVAYKNGDVLTALNDNQTYSASDWIKKVRYTDDDRFEGFITQVLNGTSTTGNDAVVAAALYAIKTALNAGVTTVNGGLILSNIIALRNSDGDIMSGMNGVYNAWAGSSHIIGGGLAAWYGGQMIDYEVLSAFDISEGWDVVHWARSALRFDGSGYFANGNISWDALGNVTIKNITTLYSSQNTDILNQLTTFSNMFHNSTWQEGGATELRIQPQQYFDHLSLKRGSGTVDGDSHYFDITGYSVLNRDEMDARYVRIDFFNRLFQAYSSTTIADANKIAPTDVSTTINNLKIMVGAWTNQYLSAFGINSSGSGGGGGATALSQLSDVELTSLASGNLLQYNGTKWVNIANNFATTAQLSGYLPLSGGTISGALTVTSSALFKNSISFRDISRATGSDYYAGMLLDNRGLYIGFDEGVNNQLNVDGAGRFNSLYIGSAAVATQSWVNSLGYIAPTLSGLANGDILVYDSVGAWVNVPISSFLSGYATQSWVNQQGFSKFNPTISSPQNRDIVVYESGGAGWLNASLDTLLSVYATQSWVTSQGYITASALNGYATEAWVGQQGYLTSSALNGYATQSWVQQRGYITSAGSCNYATSAGSVAWSNVSGRPTNVSSFTNDSGYITSAALNGYIHPTLSGLANGDILVYDSVGAWVNVTKSSFLSGYALTSQIPTNNNQLTNGAGYITSSALNGYVHPTLSNLAEGDIIVYDGSNWVNTSWPLTGYATQSWVNTQLAGYLPLTGGTMSGTIYLGSAEGGITWGALTSSARRGYALPSLGSNAVMMYSRYGGSSDEGAVIISEDTAVIFNSFDTGYGFQVHDKDLNGGNMSTTATLAFGVDQEHYAYSMSGFKKNGSSDSYVLLGGGGHAAISGLSVSYASSAGAVAWGNVSGRPTALSSFTNDSGYITSSGSCNYATSAGSVAWSNVSGRPTNVSSFTNDSGYITSSGSCNYATSSGTTNGINISANSGDILICDGGRSWVSTNLNSAISGFGYITSAGSCESATFSSILLTNNTSQNADSCYSQNPGLRFWRYNGSSSTTGQTGGDGWILSWSWNVGSVGGQIYLDDNPSKTICIRGWNNTGNGSFTTWATLLHSDNYASYLTDYATQSWVTNQGYYSSGSNPYFANIYLASYLYMPNSNGTYVSTIDRTGSSPIFGYGQGQWGYHVYYTGFTVSINGGSSWSSAGNGIYIDSSNNIGIGTSTPSYKLDVNGSANATTLYENGSRVITTANIGSQSVNYATSAGSVAWSNVSGRPTNVSSFTNDSGYITSSGSCNYATSSGTTNGINISANSGDILICDGGRSWVTIPSSYISDIRKKDVLNYNAEPTFEAVANAPAIRFTYKDARYSFNQGVKVGSIAQYWKTELPEAVNEDNEGYLSMQYEVLGLLAAIAVAKRVTNHERRIESLERENALLRLELNKLKEVA